MVKILYTFSSIPEWINSSHVYFSGSIGCFYFIARLMLGKHK